MLEFENELKNDPTFNLQINIDGIKNCNFIEYSLNCASIISLSPYMPFNFLRVLLFRFHTVRRKINVFYQKFNKLEHSEKGYKYENFKIEFLQFSDYMFNTYKFLKTLFNMFRENWTWYK